MPEIEVIAPHPTIPIASAVQYGDTLYVSGQLGFGADGKLVSGDCYAQSVQTLKNIRAILEKAGTSMDKVLKCTVFLANIADFPLMNRAYAAAFGTHRPARSAFQVANLPVAGGLVEIECVAAIKNAGRL
ncbi:Endoribonuclease L-PSP [Gonapodya prolifera JEL478]|uniref:Endoribonuclease L-PSP n=1 Tax=Gonapodya prolifera (strain JEL478) TaxID=1344416 RepID=A0A139A3D0_GONPJ|nr:Endoribonuclease L-PSP [Gonapodya prolifera JEL478]|eukprot:KXS11224.1 Endoribonuclease L-PSP [Gonapodya prolifera JEL478]